MNKTFLSITVIATLAVAMAAHADNIKTVHPGTTVLPRQQLTQAKTSTALRHGTNNSHLPSKQQLQNPYTLNKPNSGTNAISR